MHALVFLWRARLLLAGAIVAAVVASNSFHPLRDQCRSRQSEAKGNLKALYVAEESYRAEFDTYSRDFGAIGFVPKAVPIRYAYVVDEADGTHFRASARGIGGDAWSMSEANDLRHPVDACMR